ncbi:uncharacterized protein [Choristoneura fumiferana]|uniref:uncharacterized protein n=1 Tax=Choristoneura fumiferana TaxID=7141 RepID=UPI003D15641D
MSVSKTVRNVSYEQMKVMLDFMSQHVDFATGSLRSLEGRHTARQLWRDLTLILNNCQTGARKTVEKWSNYWSDFKNKLKNKVRLLKERSSHGSPEKRIRALTKMEKRALIILGPNFVEKCQTAASTQRSDHCTPNG